VSEGTARVTGDPTLSIVVATYEWPRALDVVLRVLSEEADASFEVIVADDGSGPDTAAVVSSKRDALRGDLTHAWHPDDGFQRARILNTAAREARGDYLVFIDGDTIPRRGFVAAIRRAALTGWFLSSKRLNLSVGLSRRVLADELPVWRWSALHWLARAPREVFNASVHNSPGVLIPVRDRRRPWRRGQREFFPPYWAYGFLLGVHRSDFERINGFDMRFVGWGGEDVDIAARLSHAGIRCGWPGPGASMLHLWHPVRRDGSRPNGELVDDTLASRRVEALEGLRELAAEIAEDQTKA
jgi:GT2 family glycosyltransferase